MEKLFEILYKNPAAVLQEIINQNFPELKTSGLDRGGYLKVKNSNGQEIMFITKECLFVYNFIAYLRIDDEDALKKLLQNFQNNTLNFVKFNEIRKLTLQFLEGK